MWVGKGGRKLLIPVLAFQSSCPQETLGLSLLYKDVFGKVRGHFSEACYDPESKSSREGSGHLPQPPTGVVTRHTVTLTAGQAQLGDLGMFHVFFANQK